MVMPAMAALVAGNYEGADRVTAYGVLGGTAGAGIAIGPILGGFATTELSWRVVFVGEVVVAVGIIAAVAWIHDVARPDPRPRLDGVGSVLSALGLSVMVLGVLQSSTWGWLAPLNSPIEPFGFALTPFVVAGGVAILYAFRLWEAHRERIGADPLLRFELFDIARLRSGLSTLLAQNAILMGVFFAIPLFLQIVLGLNALDTGIRMLPTSIAMFIVSFGGSLLVTYMAPRTIIRIGLGVMMIAALVLMGTIEPTLDGTSFAVGMAFLGAGMGLCASQLGNVVLSAVGPDSRSEAGGLQYTAQQLGSSLGVALIGSIVLTSLGAVYLDQIAGDQRIPADTVAAVEESLSAGVGFVPSSEIAIAVEDAGLPQDEATALVENYESSQLMALKAGLLVVVVLAGAAFLVTGNLPSTKETEVEPGDQPVAVGSG